MITMGPFLEAYQKGEILGSALASFLQKNPKMSV
jgi:hypothetical protein